MVRSRQNRQVQRRPGRRNNRRRRARRPNSVVTAFDVRGRTFRRSILAPWFPEKAKPPLSAGNWLTTLATVVGTIVPMLAKMTTRTFTTKSDAATSFPIYVISAVNIDSNYLLGVSQFVFNPEGKTGTQCRFKQIRCHRLHFRLVPSEEVSSRGGTVAYVFVPASIATASNKPDYSKLTFTEILAIPGSRYGKASRLHTLTYTPRVGDVMSMWQTVGKPNLFGAFIIGYCDLAADEEKSVANNYLPHTLGIEIETTADISLRDPGSETDPQDINVGLSYFNNPDKIRVQHVSKSGRTYFADIASEELVFEEGLVRLRQGNWDDKLGVDANQDDPILSPGASAVAAVASLKLGEADDFEHV